MSRYAQSTGRPWTQVDRDREELTLREQLVRALTGREIHRESAIEILTRWDSVDRFIKDNS